MLNVLKAIAYDWGAKGVMFTAGVATGSTLASNPMGLSLEECIAATIGADVVASVSQQQAVLAVKNLTADDYIALQSRSERAAAGSHVGPILQEASNAAIEVPPILSKKMQLALAKPYVAGVAAGYVGAVAMNVLNAQS